MKSFIQKIKGIGTEDLLYQLAEISISMLNETVFLREFQIPIISNGVNYIKTSQLSAWDIHSIQYHSICNSNDYRKSKLSYTINQIVALYREYDNQSSTANQFEKADLHGIFKLLFGMVSEQFSYQNLYWVHDNLNRNYHILFASDKIRRGLSVTLEQVINETFGLSIEEFISVQTIVFWLCMQHSDPLSAPERMYRKNSNTILTKENIEKFIKYYSCDYKEVRTSPLKEQIFNSKPFVKTDKSSSYIATNCYLVFMMTGSSLYWLIRDYYNNLNSQEFVNAFGIMFEDYLKELAQIHLSREQWRVIPTSSKNKRADFYFDLGEAIMIIEQKSTLIALSAKQQTPDLDAINRFLSRAIKKAYNQIQETCSEIESSKPIIKIILLYETIHHIKLIQSSMPEIFGSNDHFYIMTIRELEIMFYLWSTDKELCLELVGNMIQSKRSDSLINSSISKIYDDMGLYSLKYRNTGLNYSQLFKEDLEKELSIE